MFKCFIVCKDRIRYEIFIRISKSKQSFDDNVIQSDANQITEITTSERPEFRVSTKYSSSSSLIRKQKKLYKCQQCNYQAAFKNKLIVHMRSMHEPLKYPCQQCDYKATIEMNLKRHIESRHEGITYPCHQCDYEATQSSHLQRHIKSKHSFD